MTSHKEKLKNPDYKEGFNAANKLWEEQLSQLKDSHVEEKKYLLRDIMALTMENQQLKLVNQEVFSAVVET